MLLLNVLSARLNSYSGGFSSVFLFGMLCMFAFTLRRNNVIHLRIVLNTSFGLNTVTVCKWVTLPLASSNYVVAIVSIAS